MNNGGGFVSILAGLVLWLGSHVANAQDPNFYIFLCFGQSNMEGQGTIGNQDRIANSRFKVFQTVDCSNLSRDKETWYDAVPPLCRCWSGLSPADYFGRTLADSLPDHIRIGVINVAIGGSRIEIFDKDRYQNYTDDFSEDWFQNAVASYEGNPYAYLVKMAKLAKRSGVIKGFLLHQGESNSGDNQWPSKVKTVYDNLIEDLELDPVKTPILAGEVVHEDQDGAVASMNNIIGRLPETITNAHVISSSGCTDVSDNIHFDAAGYRELGKRYGLKMMELLEYDENPPLLSISKSSLSDDYKLSAVFPNPADHLTNISFAVPHTSAVSIEIFGLSGNKVALVTDQVYRAGSHTLEYDLGSVEPGVYFVKMKAGEFTTAKRLLLK